MFYQYHVDANMMGRVAGKQYPQMLAKHYASAIGLAPATLILLAQVRLPGRLGRVAGPMSSAPGGLAVALGGCLRVCVQPPCRHAPASQPLPCPCPALPHTPQWFERGLDLVGIAASGINVYCTKVGRGGCCWAR